jgi:hypothetical protein
MPTMINIKTYDYASFGAVPAARSAFVVLARIVLVITHGHTFLVTPAREASTQGKVSIGS